MIGMTICSGIGAPELSAPWIDWRYQSEIERFASAVLAKRFPNATNLGDMTKFKEWPDADIDVLCGGTPCQSFSIAGLRKGLADPRGNLALTYLAIAARYRPRWLVWENVPGVLSALSHAAPDQRPPDIDLDGDDGPEDGEEVVVTDEYRSVEDHALWCFMAGAAQLGYHGGFCTLDVQHTQTPAFERAIPQRRERVFFVGYLGDWRRAAAVLFELESLQGHPPPRREAGQGFARSLGARTQGCGREVAHSLRAQSQVAFREDQDNIVVANSGDVSHCLTASAQQSLDAETETLIAFDCKGTQVQTDETGSAPTLRSMGHSNSHQNAGGQLAVAIQERAVSENPKAGPDGVGASNDGAAYTLEARPGVQAVAHALKGEGFDASEDGTGRGTPIVPVAFAQNTRDEVRLLNGDGQISGALAADAGMKQTTYVAEPYTITERGRAGKQNLEHRQDGTANAILTPNGGRGGMGVGAIATPWAVRRLTPTECERLMGFPDGWTQIEWRGKPAALCPDGPRYKVLGNSWGRNCGEYIFDRIKLVEEMCP